MTTKGVFVAGSDETRASQAFGESDLLVVKGTWAYESIEGNQFGKTAIYLLKIKCHPLARRTGIEKEGFLGRVVA